MFGVARAWQGTVVACLLAAVAAAQAAPENPPEVPKALEKEAAKALRGRKSEIAGNLGIVHELVKRQHAAGQHKKSLSILKKAVGLAPWDMLCQVYYAEALHELGKSNNARKKALWILDHAREDRARSGAAKLADEPPPPPLVDLERAMPGAARIVLLLVPPVDDGVVHAVAARLSERLSIPVVVRKAHFVNPPKPSRGEMEEAVREYRARFEQTATDEEVDELLKRHGLKMDQLLETFVFAMVYRPWLIRTGRWKDLREFDRDVTSKRRLQWEGDTLFRWIQRAVGSSLRPKDYYLGITRVDMHLGPKMNFNYAASGGRFSIVAYAQFLPWATREDPDFDRLVTRVHKQVMCSLGRCFGILECSDFGCACAYANGLRDHDAKREDYCPRCRERISIARTR